MTRPNRARPLYRFRQAADSYVVVQPIKVWRGAVWIFLSRIPKSTATAGRQTEIWRLGAGETTPQHLTTLPSPGPYSGVVEAAAGDNVMYFDYSSGELDPVTSQVITRLWITDGTAAGTRAVDPLSSLKLGNFYGISLGSQVVGDRLFTLYNGDAAGPEIWTTDGTAVGLRRLTGDNPPLEFLPNGSLPANLTRGGDGYVYYDREVVENGLRVRRIHRILASNPVAEEVFGELPENQISVFGGAALPRAMFWAHGRLYASCYTGEGAHEFYWWPAPSAATPYSAWAAARGLALGTADPLADPERNGVPNLLEFVTGNPAGGGDSPNLPRPVFPETGRPRVALSRMPGTGVESWMESSTDLVTWQRDVSFAPDGTATVHPGGRLQIQSRTGAGPETIILEALQAGPQPDIPRLYFRQGAAVP